MNKRISIFVSSLAAIVLCMTLVVGATFAIGVSSAASVDISLKVGRIDIAATIDAQNMELYSVKPDNNGELTDESNRRYSYEKQKSGAFASGGTAEFGVDRNGDKNLVIEKMCAGDKIKFTIDIENKRESSVDVKYNVVVSLVGQESNKLFDGLEVTLENKAKDESVVKRSAADFRTDDGTGKSVKSGWTALAVGDSTKVDVSLGLPVSASGEYGNLSAKLRCTVSAIQSMPDSSDETLAVITDENGEPMLDENGDHPKFLNLQDAIAYAPEGSTIELKAGNSDPENVNINITKSVKVTSADGEIYRFKNVHFFVADGKTLELSYVGLDGDSYIDVSNAASAVIDHCEFAGTPSLLFDEASRKYLDKAASIAATGVQRSGVSVTVNDCVFTPTDGTDSAAVYLDCALADGSEVKDNIFGRSLGAGEAIYGTSPVVINNAVNEATVTVANNRFCLADGVTAAVFGKSGDGRYFARMSGNTVLSSKLLAEVKDGAAVALTDGGSTADGAKVTLESFKYSGNLFFGIDATFNINDRITGGTYKLSSALDEDTFRSVFVASEATEGAVNTVA